MTGGPAADTRMIYTPKLAAAVLGLITTILLAGCGDATHRTTQKDARPAAVTTSGGITRLGQVLSARCGAVNSYLSVSPGTPCGLAEAEFKAYAAAATGAGAVAHPRNLGAIDGGSTVYFVTCDEPTGAQGIVTCSSSKPQRTRVAFTAYSAIQSRPTTTTTPTSTAATPNPIGAECAALYERWEDDGTPQGDPAIIEYGRLGCNNRAQ